MGVMRRRARWAAWVAPLWLLSGACGPSSHDLEVVNRWDRGVVLYVVAERAGLPDQQLPLGSVQAGGHAAVYGAPRRWSGSDPPQVRLSERHLRGTQRCLSCW